MTLLADMDDRSVEAPPARRLRAIASGNGPRAPWLASAVGGLLALGLLSVAAAPVAIEAKSWLKSSMRVDEPSALTPRGVLLPAMAAAAAVVVATAVAHALAHGGWVKLGARRRRGQVPALQRAKSAAGGWMLGVAALVGGVTGSFPWLSALPELARRPLSEGAWAVAAFVGSATLGALLATVLLGMLQLRLAMRAFDRTLRMTHAEAREAAREEASATRRRPAARLPWRVA